MLYFQLYLCVVLAALLWQTLRLIDERNKR